MVLADVRVWAIGKGCYVYRVLVLVEVMDWLEGLA